jgi:K+-sensing histidine kinase KdpD
VPRVTREALLHLKAHDVTAYNSLQGGEVRVRRADIIDRLPPGRPRSFDGLKGNLRIFYDDSSHIGAVLAVLRAARTARRRGVDIVVGHMPLHRAPPRHVKRAHDLMAEFECLPLERAIDRESEIDFDVATALRRHPAIIATGRMVSTGVGVRRERAALDRWHLRIEELLGAGVDVWTAVYDNVRPERRRRTSVG